MWKRTGGREKEKREIGRCDWATISDRKHIENKERKEKRKRGKARSKGERKRESKSKKGCR
jgi:hypothetical protein